MALRACSLLLLATALDFVLALEFPVWCVQPSTLHVRQNETCTSIRGRAAWTKQNDTIALSAMRGEEENAQVLLCLQSWPSDINMTAKLSVTFTDLLPDDNLGVINTLTSIPKSRLRWWQVGFVYCKHTTMYPDSGGGWRPDPLLSPSSSNSIQLETGVTTLIWVSLRVPYGVATGTYRGNMTLSISGEKVDTLTQWVPVEVIVWNIDLPQLKDTKFPAIFSFRAENLKAVYKIVSEQLKEQFYSLLLEQRVAGDNLYTSTPTSINDAFFLASRGVNWLSLYDVYGMAGPGIPGLRKGLKGYCVNFTDAMVQGVLDILTPVIVEYQSSGLLERMFVYGFDEVAETCEQSMRKIFGAIKERWPSLRTVATLNWGGGMPTDLPLDVWVLQYEFFNASTAAIWTASGKQQWWYHSIDPSQPQYLNTFIERPLIETRLLFWLACSQNVGGWLYYSVVRWVRYPISNEPISRIDGTSRTNFDPANYIWYPRTDIFANGDGNFIYPGENGPVPSIRLHNLRDGFEDAELLHMLKAEEVKELVKPLVQSPTSFSLDSRLLEKQRSTAAALVCRAAL